MPSIRIATGHCVGGLGGPPYFRSNLRRIIFLKDLTRLKRTELWYDSLSWQIPAKDRVMPPACPRPDDIDRLALGTLTEDEALLLEQHVDTCSDCVTRLNNTLTGDPLFHWLQAPAPGQRDEPNVRKLVERIKSVPKAHSVIQPMITFSCTGCQKKLNVKDQLAGKKVKCPGCGVVLAVPAGVAVAGQAEDRTIAPKGMDLPERSGTLAPKGAMAEDPVTHPPKSTPDATVDADREPGPDSALTDFLGPPQQDDELGRLGKYRILKVLGHGGMGVVFKAEDPKLKRLVAIKAMLPTLAASASAAKRFTREAEAMAAVEHQHVVRVYEISEDRGVPFLAMEFLKGEPLDERLQSDAPLSQAEMLRIARQIAVGLDAAHATGLIHRDIKPGNIWLQSAARGGDVQVKILDFGLARAGSENTGLTQQGAIIGTPAYMAPEQARGDTVDSRSDLFSLGVVLYRMATGHAPFKGVDVVSTLMAVATTEPQTPSAIKSSVGPEFSALIMKLLAKDPTKRFQTAAEVVADIAKIEQSAPASGVRQSPDSSKATTVQEGSKNQGADAPRSPKSRLPLVAAGLALAALLAAGIVFFIPSANGTICVEINDPAIEVALISTGAKIKASDGMGEIHVSPGEHGLKVKRGDLEFETDKIVLKKGETITLKVEWLKDRLTVARADDGKTVGAKWVKGDGVPTPLWQFTLQFAGNEAEVRIPTLKLDGEAPYTLETWARADAISDQGLVVKMGGDRQAQIMQSKNLWHASENRLRTGLYNSAVVLGKLTHLAFVVDIADARFYVDGKLVKQGTLRPEGPEKDIWPSSFLRNKSFRFDGLIGPTRVSRSARYTKDFSPQPRFEADKDTLALYHMDEGHGDVLTDSSGNGHHGRIVGAKWVKVNADTGAEHWPLTPFATSRLAFNGTDKVILPDLKLDFSKPLTIEGYAEPGRRRGTNCNLFSGTPELCIRLHTAGEWQAFLMGIFSLKAPPMEVPHRAHVAMVVSHKAGTMMTVQLFVDGRSVAEKDFDSTKVAPIDAGSLLLGRDFAGKISEVRFSTSARYKANFTPAARFQADKETLALYHMDDGEGDVLKDSSGNGHHGKIVGAKWVKTEVSKTPSFQPGKSPFALKFGDSPKNSHDHVLLPDLKLDINESFTVEGYVTAQSDISRSTVGFFGYGGIRLQSGPYWSLSLVGETNKVLQVGLPPKSGNKVDLNQRMHVAVVRSGQDLKLFLNGRLIDSKPALERLKAPVSAPERTLGTSLIGLLDQIRVSQSARYDKDFAPPSRFENDKSTLALYHFDEGQGDVLTDSSGKGHHGKIVGAKWVKADGTPITPASRNALEFAFEPASYVEVVGDIVDFANPFTWECNVQSDKQFGQNFACPIGTTGGILFINHREIGFGIAEDNKEVQRISQGKLSNRPTHLAGVFTGTRMLLFVDGRLMAEEESRSLLKTKERVLGIGRRFNGRIWEIRISKVARYTKDFTPVDRHVPDADTLALYHMDEGEGDVLKDSSGNGHHGKIVGAKWVKVDGIPNGAGGLASTGIRWPLTPSSLEDMKYFLGLEGALTLRTGADSEVTVSDTTNMPTVPATIVGLLFNTNKKGLLNDEVFTRLGAMIDLESLTFNNNKETADDVTNEGRKQLARLVNLRHLSYGRIGKYPITTPELFLPHLQKLESLTASGTGWAEHAGKIAGLREIHLTHPVTEADLAHLAKLQRLTLFDISNPETSLDPVKKFAERMPHCKVIMSRYQGQTDKEPFVQEQKAYPGVPFPASVLEFNTKGRIEVPTLLLNKPEPVTIEMVFTSANSRGIDHFAGHADGLRLRCLSATRVQARAGLSDQGNSNNVQMGFFAPGRQEIAVVYTGKEIIGFQNGRRFGPISAKDFNPALATAPFLIGKDFGGQIHQVRISKVARYLIDYAPRLAYEADKDTVALYRCDEGQGDVLKDSSGNNHHGKIFGAKWVKADDTSVNRPPVKQALRFDGAQRVDIPDLKLPTDGPYTMEGVFHPDNDKAGGVDNHAMGVPFQSHLSYTKGSTWRWAGARSKDAKSGIANIQAPSRPHHIACVYDGKERRVYVDGQQVGKSTYAPEVALNRTFELGNSYFGTIDEVRISKVARYQGNFVPQKRFEPDADTIALYHCDEGEGEILTDSSGNGRHGKIVGAKWVRAEE